MELSAELPTLYVLPAPPKILQKSFTGPRRKSTPPGNPPSKTVRPNLPDISFFVGHVIAFDCAAISAQPYPLTLSLLPKTERGHPVCRHRSGWRYNPGDVLHVIVAFEDAVKVSQVVIPETVLLRILEQRSDQVLIECFFFFCFYFFLFSKFGFDRADGLVGRLSNDGTN
jgi:hypothetical protein